MRLSIAAPTTPVVLPEAQVSCPGCAFARAMNSGMLRAGTLSFTAKTKM